MFVCGFTWFDRIWFIFSIYDCRLQNICDALFLDDGEEGLAIEESI
jgi:hypothetical protein